MADIRFEWDEAKNLANRKKHGVSFEEGSQVFRDPLYVSVNERAEDGGRAMADVRDCRQRIAAHGCPTVREEQAEGKTIEVIPIISTRHATPKERRRYEDENSSLYA